jgi:hypothetical protein
MSYSLKTVLALLLFGGLLNSLYSQNILTDQAELHGNFQLDAQYYNIDTLIGAPIVPEKILSNGFMNLWYTKGNFSAGIRYENYLNVMQGFDSRFKGSGIPFRFATYTNDKLEATVGNFYEQFGGGLILRAYEERGLGFDNVLDGARVKYEPIQGLVIKALVARQRAFFSLSPGILRGSDIEVNVNDVFFAGKQFKTRVVIGASALSRYQDDQDPVYNLPENVAAFGGRLNVIRGKFNVAAEYGYKINDPSATNKLIYRPGQALNLSATYSTKGFGILVSAKRLDNFDFRSDRAATGNANNINFLPAATRQHTYNLPATIYPYATQPNGEMGYQVELSWKIKKGSLLGGKYGTEITINASGTNGLDKSPSDNDTLGYESEFFKVGKEVYFRDYHIEIHKKFNKSWKSTLMLLYWVYNKDVVQGLKGFGTIYAPMAVLDVAYKINDKNTIRIEAQSLLTKQDEGSWAMGLIEYTYSPNWFVAIVDQYNFGNQIEDKRIHYLTLNAGFMRKGNRIMVGYGRQRAGIFCVGGVCRNVPASNGLTISILSSF